MKIIKANLKTGEETEATVNEVRNVYGFLGGFNDVGFTDYMSRTGPIDDRDGQYLYLLDTVIDRRILGLEKEKIVLTAKNKKLKIEIKQIEKVLNKYEQIEKVLREARELRELENSTE